MLVGVGPLGLSSGVRWETTINSADLGYVAISHSSAIRLIDIIENNLAGLMSLLIGMCATVCRLAGGISDFPSELSSLESHLRSTCGISDCVVRSFFIVLFITSSDLTGRHRLIGSWLPTEGESLQLLGYLRNTRRVYLTHVTLQVKISKCLTNAKKLQLRFDYFEQSSLSINWGKVVVNKI